MIRSGTHRDASAHRGDRSIVHIGSSRCHASFTVARSCLTTCTLSCGGRRHGAASPATGELAERLQRLVEMNPACDRSRGPWRPAPRPDRRSSPSRRAARCRRRGGRSSARSATDGSQPLPPAAAPRASRTSASFRSRSISCGCPRSPAAPAFAAAESCARSRARPSPRRRAGQGCRRVLENDFHDVVTSKQLWRRGFSPASSQP